MSIFSKTTEKEYNEKLENILESKRVDSEAKNLLLSMLYKIENSYEDYYIVKSNATSKEAFIKKILKIVEEECHEIIVATPETEISKPLEKAKQNCIVDPMTGSILTYANEKDLLYAIYMLDIKYNQIKIDKEFNLDKVGREELLKYRAIQNFFSTGTAMNESEVIRDFSGWSWSINEKDIEDINVNLIYQNILLLIGTKTRDEVLIPKAPKQKYSSLNANVEDLRKYNQIEDKSKKKNIKVYNEILKEAFSKRFDYEQIKDMIYDINLAIFALEIKRDKQQKRYIENRFREEKKIVTLMEKRESFLETLEINKKQLEIKIKKIDRLLNNKSLLTREYYVRNEGVPDKDKIFSVSQLAKLLEQEKQQYEKEIETENKLKDEKKYKEKQAQYSREVKFYAGILGASEKMNIMLIRIQLEFLKCFMSLIERAKTKDELLELVYDFRYYCLLPVDNETKIKDIPELQDAIREVINALIDRCIDKKIIENISNTVSLCYIILKYIFKTQTINLENLSIRITKDKEEVMDANGNNRLYYITIDLFDGKEQVESHTEIVDNLKLLNIRLKRKTQLFLW